jgi:hypothetical protein
MKLQTLNIIKDIAREWPQGIVVINPNRTGEEVIIAITEVIICNPSNNIHHTSVRGKDITLFVNQGGQVPGSRQTISTYIESIQWRDEWELPPSTEFVWVRQVPTY